MANESKKTSAVDGVTPINNCTNECETMREDLVQYCAMIVTNVVDGTVKKTGLITNKEKLAKLLDTDNVEVVEAEIEKASIKGHPVIATVSANGRVCVPKNNNETKEESNNETNTKGEITMENKENKVVNAEVENKENKTETAAAPVEQPAAAEVVDKAAPDTVAGLQVPTDQLDAEARAKLGKTVSEKIKAGEVKVHVHTRVVTNKQLAIEAAWTVGGIAAGFLVCLGLSKLFGRD